MVLIIWKRYVDSPTSRHKDYFKLCTQDFDIEKDENYWIQTLPEVTLFYMVNFKLILHFRLYWMHLFYSVTELTFFSFLSCVVTFQKLIWIITMKLKNKYKSMKEKQNWNIINSYFKIKKCTNKRKEIYSACSNMLTTNLFEILLEISSNNAVFNSRLDETKWIQSEC